MHLFGIGLHVLIALFFAVHAVRSGQSLYWLLILFMFPLLGSAVYALAIWLPDLRGSRTARRAGHVMRRLVDPDRDLREAQAAVATTPTVANRARLGEALIAAGRAAEALPHLQAAAQGLYADDPDLQALLARAELDGGQPDAARDRLDALIAAHPDYRSPTAHLAYARAVAACGDRARAHEEFAVLLDSFPGLEARARYADLLADWGETARARALANETLAGTRRLPQHTRDAERAWIARLERRARG